MSWEQLLGILQESRDIQAKEQSTPPVACPNDGTPLEQGRDGELRCRFDGWSNRD
jgi:hypothetical protein